MILETNLIKISTSVKPKLEVILNPKIFTKYMYKPSQNQILRSAITFKLPCNAMRGDIIMSKQFPHIMCNRVSHTAYSVFAEFPEQY